MREKFKAELDSKEQHGIISNYHGRGKSPEWHVCLDPTDLNKEIVTPVCNSRTINDIFDGLRNAEHFAVFDTSEGVFTAIR